MSILSRVHPRAPRNDVPTVIPFTITDNGDGTISLLSAPAAPAAPTITDNGDGTINVEMN